MVSLIWLQTIIINRLKIADFGARTSGFNGLSSSDTKFGAFFSVPWSDIKMIIRLLQWQGKPQNQNLAACLLWETWNTELFHITWDHSNEHFCGRTQIKRPWHCALCLPSANQRYFSSFRNIFRSKEENPFFSSTS